jgi:serine/threonine protein kinase
MAAGRGSEARVETIYDAEISHHGGPAAAQVGKRSNPSRAPTALYLAPPPADAETVAERRLNPPPASLAADSPRATPVNDTIGDFELVALLGQGTCGKVYLARERSLNRTVAVKIVADAGAEAHTLAQLEHEHIVRVFSETVEPELGRRLICMQHVPGTTLGRVTARLRDRGDDATGAALVRAIDSLSVLQAPLDPAERRERAELEQADAVAAVCAIGAALARALAHAHGRGVVHNDVKPHNILLTPCGRPMLVDFNIASSPTQQSNPRGMTMSYAAPEQLLAFCGQLPREAVGPRADLYSLGLVLFEVLAGHSPFEPLEQSGSIEGQYRMRRLPLRRLNRPEPSARVLERTLRRCLAVDPARRYASADELAEALDACAALRTYENELPAAGPVTRLATRWPLASTFVAGFLPNVIGAIVGCGYLVAVLNNQVGEPLVHGFLRTMLFYVSIVFPVGGAGFAIRALGLSLRFEQLNAEGAKAFEAVALRQRLIAAPAVAGRIAMLGWALGIPSFPLIMALTGGEDLPIPVRIHHVTFGALAALIAHAFTSIFVRHATLRLLLPWATVDGRDLEASVDLSAVPFRLRAQQLIAVTGLPAAAVVVLAFWPEPLMPLTRALLGALMWIGALGVALAMHSASESIRCAEALERLRARVAR